MKKIGYIIALVCFLIGLAILLLTPVQIPGNSSSAVGIDAKFFPKFSAICIMIASVGLFVENLLSEAPADGKLFTFSEEKNVLLSIVIILVYTVLMNYIGFYIATLILGTSFLVLFRAKKWYYYLIYFAFATAAYFFFTNVLFIHFPKLGVWFF